MNSTAIGIGVLAVLVAVFLLKRVKVGGSFPPHEFAYGAPLKSCEAIPGQIETFLSLTALDPTATRIETFVDTRSEKNLKPLISYISSLGAPELEALISALKAVDQISDQKEKAVELVKTLLPYKQLLDDESSQDRAIIFVMYGVKQPVSLSPEERAEIGSLVKQFDTAKQSAAFDSGKCPTDYLGGNINIYPLALGNTNWHNFVDLGSANDAPVLEIRFMGLTGIFRYLLSQMTQRTGDSFKHLDGNSI